MTSIMETHLGWVQKLKDRGEAVQAKEDWHVD